MIMLRYMFRRGLIARYKWETLYHPPYSSDLRPCVFDLLPRLKEDVQGVRFEDLEELEGAVAEQVRMYERGCLATGIQKLPSRWRPMIEHKGPFLEEF